MLGRQRCASWRRYKAVVDVASGRPSAAPSNRAITIRASSLYSKPTFASALVLNHLQLPFLAPRMSGLQASSMANGSLRSREHSTKSTAANGQQHAGPSTSTAAASHAHDHAEGHDHDHEHDNGHAHSHSMFGGHTHGRDEGPSQGAESVVKVLEGKADRGSRITLIGLVVNVGLTASKGAAGWFMNSAALLAEAGHSASDLLGDFVTLFAWRFSRRAPSAAYPYGFGKFETLGTTALALILVGGALGIGVHSLNLLLHHLADTAAALPPGPAQVLVQNMTDVAQSVSSAAQAAGLPAPGAHSHGHGHGHGALDPNAAWFAAASVLAKEWLYRATKKVADEERSGVLLANAVHHRSDAYTSMVALCAILGTWWFPALPLDPIGGLLVSLVILRQGISLFGGAFGELTDAGVSPRTHRVLQRALQPLVSDSPSAHSQAALLAINDLRAMRRGAVMFVDVTARVPRALSVGEAVELENKLRDALLEVRKEISEVRVKFVPANDDDESLESTKGEQDSSSS